jgi:hypothetical protein
MMPMRGVSAGAIDQAVYDLRVEISQAASRMADERGAPPLDHLD